MFAPFLIVQSSRYIFKQKEDSEKHFHTIFPFQYNKIGHKAELAISKSMAKNFTLLRLGYNFESRGPRHTCNKYIMRNNDIGKCDHSIEFIDRGCREYKMSPFFSKEEGVSYISQERTLRTKW